MQKRKSQVEIMNGMLKCLSERPMGLSEIAEAVFEKESSEAVGRIAVRIEGMMVAGLVKPLVIKNRLMFKLGISNDRGK